MGTRLSVAMYLFANGLPLFGTTLSARVLRIGEGVGRLPKPPEAGNYDAKSIIKVSSFDLQQLNRTYISTCKNLKGKLYD